MKTESKSRKQPAALWGLAISAFGIGTTELVIVGLLPTLATDLKISISYTGWLVTLYALGVAIGGPILTALTSRIPRKHLVLGLMVLFILGNSLAALAPSFIILVIGRILSGIAHGVFFAIGATIASSLVSPEKRGTAIAIMFGGLTIAMVTGVPLGTFIGQHWGWRSTFIGVSFLGIIGFMANLLMLPSNIHLTKPVPLLGQLRILKKGPIALVLITTALAFAGTFCAFTYMANLLEQVTCFSSASISLLLLVYGVAIAVGNMIGGKAADKQPAQALVLMFLLLSIILLLLYFVITIKFLTVVMLFIMGLLAFCNVPALQLYIVQLAERHLPGTEDIASAFNIAAFNVGIALGAYVGGKVVDSTLGLRAILWIGAIFVFMAFLLSYVSWKRNKI